MEKDRVVNKLDTAGAWCRWKKHKLSGLCFFFFFFRISCQTEYKTSNIILFIYLKLKVQMELFSSVSSPKI